jgi:hypothetical protein
LGSRVAFVAGRHAFVVMTKRARQRQNRAIIGADVRRFAHVSKRIEFSVHTAASRCP